MYAVLNFKTNFHLKIFRSLDNLLNVINCWYIMYIMYNKSLNNKDKSQTVSFYSALIDIFKGFTISQYTNNI